MAKTPATPTGGRLEEAMAVLIQNQAMFIQNQAAFLSRMSEMDRIFRTICADRAGYVGDSTRACRT